MRLALDGDALVAQAFDREDEVRDAEVSDEEVARSMPDPGTSDADPASFLNP